MTKIWTSITSNSYQKWNTKTTREEFDDNGGLLFCSHMSSNDFLDGENFDFKNHLTGECYANCKRWRAGGLDFVGFDRTVASFAIGVTFSSQMIFEIKGKEIVSFLEFGILSRERLFLLTYWCTSTWSSNLSGRLDVMNSPHMIVQALLFLVLIVILKPSCLHWNTIWKWKKKLIKKVAKFIYILAPGSIKCVLSNNRPPCTFMGQIFNNGGRVN